MRRSPAAAVLLGLSLVSFRDQYQATGVPIYLVLVAVCLSGLLMMLAMDYSATAEKRGATTKAGESS